MQAIELGPAHVLDRRGRLAVQAYVVSQTAGGGLALAG